MRGEFIDLAGERLYYYAAGSRGSGEPIVLIHGFPTSSHLWLDVVAKLPPGHRVIVFDLLGFGRSDAPLTADYSVGAHGARLLHLLDVLRIELACFVGHGIGGAIAQWVAVNHAERISRGAAIEGTPLDNWFSRARPVGLAFRRLALRLPAWGWMSLMRYAIAREYADAERGSRSADLYLMPFREGDHSAILRRHLEDLANGEIAALARQAPQRVLVLSGSRRHHPEEAPSDVAAAIATLFSAG